MDLRLGLTAEQGLWFSKQFGCDMTLHSIKLLVYYQRTIGKLSVNYQDIIGILLVNY